MLPLLIEFRWSARAVFQRPGSDATPQGPSNPNSPAAALAERAVPPVVATVARGAVVALVVEVG
jgi:hypothetical protein